MINAILSSVPNVVHLDLSNSLCTDTNLLCIRRMCPVLVSLDLTNCKITYDGITKLCGTYQSLRKLDLTGTFTEPLCVYAILNGFPLLEQLKTERMAIMLYDIFAENLTYAFKNIRYNLTELIFDDDVTENIVKVLHTWTVLCPFVTRVYIKNATRKKLEMCSRFEYLEILEINAPEINIFLDEDMMYGAVNVLAPFIPKGNRLTKLVLTNVEISIKILMECFGNLRTLCLQKVTFTEFLEGDLTLKENKLEDLVLEEVPLDVPVTCQAILSIVSVSINVITLHFSSAKELPQNLCDAILNFMKNLSFVHLDAPVPPENLPSIQRFFQIPSLEIYECNISGATSRCVELSCYFPRTLTRTTLSWCKCDDDSDESDVQNFYDSDENYESYNSDENYESAVDYEDYYEL